MYTLRIVTMYVHTYIIYHREDKPKEIQGKVGGMLLSRYPSNNEDYIAIVQSRLSGNRQCISRNTTFHRYTDLFKYFP